MNLTRTPYQQGAIVAPLGFKASGVHAGFRHNQDKKDLALLEARDVCVAAGVFTQNAFCAAPVQLCRERLGEAGAEAACGATCGAAYGTARAVVVNSGIANAATGPAGLDAAREVARMAADVVGCAEEDVLVASTGVIGVQLPLEPFERGLPEAHSLASDMRQPGHDAACAIMTTDTMPKEVAYSWKSNDPACWGSTFTVGGCCKGSGMIMPNMATMIALITTDFLVTGPAAHAALRAAVNESFNKVTVDSDTSTNDTCLLLASGEAAPDGMEPVSEGVAYQEFCDVLRAVCEDLARLIAMDGEGATRLVTVVVEGAATDADADMAARAIANSPLVKTAIAGHDANWGRVAAAVGKSGAAFSQENVDIDMLGLPVLRGGLPVNFSEAEALARFEEPEIVIEVNLGAGDCSTQIWTCDFTHEYISINGDYRS